MEREIFFIGLRKLYSKKQEKEFYIVDYVDIKNTPQTDYITIEEYNRIASKTKGKEYSKLKGIFELTPFNKVYLTDIKG